MIRNLAMIAVAGFVLSIACITAAISIGGPDAMARSAWSWNSGRHWNVGWSSDDHSRHDDGGPSGSRDLPWSGGATLKVEVPAEITYTQAPGPAKLTIEGPPGDIDHLVVRDGVLTFADGAPHRAGDLSITMTAPNLNRFELQGGDKLTLRNYDQDSLALQLSGDAEVDGSGKARTVDLDISGSANADLSGLKATDAAVRISGSGEAKVAPLNAAKIAISGSGDVYLESRPAHVETDISGSGQLHQDDD